MSDPISNREDYDHVILAGQRSPGICTIERANSPRRLIERTGVGLSGARVRFAGVMLSHFKLILHLFTVEHWADWNDFRPLLAAPPIGVRAHALDIEHPFLADLGIRSVLIEDVAQPVKANDNGEWSIEIALCEYRNPQPALSAPTGASNGPAETENEYTIRQLTTEFRALDQAGTLAGPPGAP